MPGTDCLTPADLAALQVGDLPEATLAEFEAHLETCPRCEAAARALDTVTDPLLAAIRRSVATSPTAAEHQLPQRIGDYEVLAEIGRGGMGVVYRAKHRKLQRVVALKMLLEGEFADPGERQRFLREAESVARLQHPNIVQIFEIGEHSAGTDLTRPYFTLELVEGGNLAARLNGRPVTSRQAATWLEPLARAIQYAHEQGIIHRDLKPFNVLLTGDGKPKVCDFGIAKLLRGVEDKTRTGMILGTPEYMAPEQAAGETAIGPAADIHALGALLYTMLTGRPPFQGTAGWDILQHVQTHEPVSPRRLQPAVPRDLETICLKCLRKEPQHRYSSAGALADDLRRHLDGRPILARRVGPLARAWKWAKRRPAPAGLLALAFLVLTVGFPLMTLLWFRADSALKAEAVQRDRAETALDRLESAVYAGRITLADHAYKANDIGVALDLLAQCEPEPGRPDLRGWEWYYLTRICHADLLPGMGHGTLADAWVNAVAVSRDGRRIVSAAGLPFFGFTLIGYAPGDYARIPGELNIWDAATGKRLSSLKRHQASVYRVAFSPDGKWLASGGLDGSVCLWDGETFEPRPGPSPAAKGDKLCLAFSPDSRRLAVAAADGIRLWDFLAGRPEPVRFPGAGWVTFSSDGHRLVAVGGAEAVKMWDVRTGADLTHEVLSAFATFHPSAGWCAAQSPDGRYLALAQDSTIEVWETTGKKRHHFLSGHTNTIRALAFCPDGLLASGADDRTIRLWDVEKDFELRTYRGHGGGVTSLAITADGKRLISGSKDRSVKVWDLTHESGVSSFQGFGAGEYLYNLTFTGDSRRLLVVHPQRQPADRHQIRAWDVNTESIQTLSSFKKMEAPPPYQIFVWSGDSGRLAGNDSKAANIIITWDSATGGEIARLHSRQAEARPLALSHDGRQIVFSGHTIQPAEKGEPIHAELCLADVDSGQVVRALPMPPRWITGGAFSPDGSRLAVAASEMLRKEGRIIPVPAPATEVHVFDTTTGQPVVTFLAAQDAPARGLAFSPDGRQLATAGLDGKVHLWDLTTGRDVFPPRQTSTELTSVAFSPDGRRLAATGLDSLVRLWDARTGHDLLVLKGFGPPGTGHYGFTARVVFSPDGRFFAANAWDATVNVWDAGNPLISGQ